MIRSIRLLGASTVALLAFAAAANAAPTLKLTEGESGPALPVGSAITYEVGVQMHIWPCNMTTEVTVLVNGPTKVQLSGGPTVGTTCERGTLISGILTSVQMKVKSGNIVAIDKFKPKLALTIGNGCVYEWSKLVQAAPFFGPDFVGNQVHGKLNKKLSPAGCNPEAETANVSGVGYTEAGDLFVEP